MEFIESELFGRLPSPESLSEILSLTKEHCGTKKNVYMWRGQADFSWPIHSAAYRRIYKTDPESSSEIHMRIYEKRLIAEACHQGYDYENGRKLSDLEILARLQHHGAATRLLDFSRNLLVALWFACKSEKNSIGMLLGIHTDKIGGYEGELQSDSYDSVMCDKDFLAYDYPQTWQPPVVSKRIASQSAQFLYSAVSKDPMGSLQFDKSNESYIAMAINPKVKGNLLKLLQGTFDIHQLTLFPDIDGFSIANSERYGTYDNYRW